MLYVAEPPTAYLYQPPIVVDCSVMVAALFEEEVRAQAISLMAGKKMYAPNLLDHELVHVAVKKIRSGWPTASVRLALASYAAQAIELHETDPLEQFEIALRYDLSAYDAAYLWLAAALRAPLATFDQRLAEAAQAHLGQL